MTHLKNCGVLSLFHFQKISEELTEKTIEKIFSVDYPKQNLEKKEKIG